MSSTKFLQFHNPAYQEEFREEGTEIEEDSNGNDEDMSDISETLLFPEEYLNLDELNSGKITTDDPNIKWRYGPAPLTDNSSNYSALKLAQLEGAYTSNDDAKVNKDLMVEKEEENNANASASLINYFANLGTTDSYAEVDYRFIDDLVTSADINSTDVHGQSIMHEVAREWHVDLARFLKSKCVNIDIADNWGRTPLFVACASNHTSMVIWLLDHGANLDHRTMKGEGQSPIHYAAKYDALECFKVLLERGANPNERDDRARTPLFLAAELGIPRMCSFMLNMDLPTVSYADNGIAAIDHMVGKLPTQLAYASLDQFIVEDRSSRRVKHYISCLGKRRWRLLNRVKACTTKFLPPPAPLEIITSRKDLDLIMHPIILKFIALKREHFGLKFNVLSIVLNVLFTIIWTIAMSIPHKYAPNQETHNDWFIAIIVLTTLGQLFSFMFMIKLFLEYRSHLAAVQNEKKILFLDLEIERQLCHPRWPEENHLKKNEELAKRLSSTFWRDGWNYIEVFCLLLATGSTITTYIFAALPTTNNIHHIRNGYSAVFVIFLWLRLNRSLRLMQTMGPFIAMLGECVIATTRFAFLFFEFFIPFSVAFWVLFGNKRKGSDGGEYETFNDMLYQLYLLTIVGDYDFDTLRKVDELSSHILVGLYFVLVSIISLNLYIALLSEAVARVNQTASATSFLKEAEELINIERIIPEIEENFEKYINKHCAPKIEPLNRQSQNGECSARELITDLSRSLVGLKQTTQTIIDENITMKKCIEVAEEKMREFNEKYNEEKVHYICNGFSDLCDSHNTKFNQIRRKGNRIVDFIDKNILNRGEPE